MYRPRKGAVLFFLSARLTVSQTYHSRSHQLAGVHQDTNIDLWGEVMDQRIRKDRRRKSGKQAFPFNDSAGQWVSQERRRFPDRRMQGVAEGDYLGTFAAAVSGQQSSENDDW